MPCNHVARVRASGADACHDNDDISDQKNQGNESPLALRLAYGIVPSLCARPLFGRLGSFPCSAIRGSLFKNCGVWPECADEQDSECNDRDD